MIYMDASATSFLKPPQVEAAVCRALHTIGNAGRGAHAPTLAAARLIYETREKLSGLFGISDPSRLAFTCNATEGLNIAIHGLASMFTQNFAPGHPPVHFITTACEHNSVLRPLYTCQDAGIGLTILDADEKGRIHYEDMEMALKPETKAIVITHASNLTGNVTDLARVSAFAHKHGLILVVDASQTAGAIPINVETMGIDILCFTGHKGLMGPQGTGGIYVRQGLSLPSFKTGGSGIHSFDRAHPAQMPAALEAGTVNGHGIAGLNGALDFINEVGVETIHEKEDRLARSFAEEIRTIPGVTIYGDLDAPLRAPIISLNIQDMPSSLVSDILWDDYEICVRAGAHCAPLMHRALGTENRGSVRFSFSYFNTEEEIRTAARAIQEIAQG